MTDIQEIEEGVLIEADFYPYRIGNLLNDIEVRNGSLDMRELFRMAGNVIGSLWTLGFIKVIKTGYRMADEDTFEPMSHTVLSDAETREFLKNPDKWDEMDILSDTLAYELEITEDGRNYLESAIRTIR
ncbi:MAG: hypothetical protein EPN93_06480 [Spirochaetes bacterium]|nr:MAG: hypothetical protein EPN93_06480 [Spirochaetota bacterium]